MSASLQRITEANDAIISKIYDRITNLYYSSSPKKRNKKTKTLESIIKTTHNDWSQVAFNDAIRIANGNAILELDTKLIDRYFAKITK